jgi:hypothetical protein
MRFFPFNRTDPWGHLLDELMLVSNGFERHTSRQFPTARVKSRRAYRPSPQLVVNIVERTGPTSATVTWSEPSCRYGYQTWRAVISRVSGVCVLSGKAIRRGDIVFRPQARPIPLNVDAMILASVVDGLAPAIDGSDYV